LGGVPREGNGKDLDWAGENVKRRGGRKESGERVIKTRRFRAL